MAPRTRPGASAALLALALAGLLAGCLDGSTWSSSNEPDRFRFQVSASDRTADEEWDWSTAGGTLRVVASLNATSGTARLVLGDAAGRVLLDETMDAQRPTQDITLHDVPRGDAHLFVHVKGLTGAFSARIDRVGTGA